MNKKPFYRTGMLFKNSLKQNRVISILLIFLPFILAYGVAASNRMVLNTDDVLQTYIIQNQGNILLGDIYGNTIEAASVWRVRTSAAILLSVFNIVLAVSSTRKEEDAGQSELVRSGSAGRFALLSAVMIKLYVINFLGGLFMAAGFAAAAFPVAGSLVAGLSVAGSSLSIAVIAAIFAQLAPDARLARGLSFGSTAVLLAIHMGINSMGRDDLLFLTPFGFCAYAKPYVENKTGILLFALIVTAVLTVCTFLLYHNRDLGRGYLPEASGRRSGGRFLRTPFALAFRLQRGMFFAWIIIYALMGTVIASILPSINDIMGKTAFAPELATAVGGSGRAFLAILAYILTQIVTVYSLLAFFRVREEEMLNRMELILSEPVSRVHYMAGHLFAAYGGSAISVIIFGSLTGDLISYVSRIPAIWLITSIAVFLYGIVPEMAASLSWGIFGALLLLEFLWEMRIINDLIFKISPFAWVYPGSSASAFNLGIMLICSLILLLTGMRLYNKRNITV